MDMIILLTNIVIQMFLITLAYKVKSFYVFILSMVMGVVNVVELVIDSKITYISNGVIITLENGGSYLLLPVMLLVFVSMIGVVVGLSIASEPEFHVREGGYPANTTLNAKTLENLFGDKHGKNRRKAERK